MKRYTLRKITYQWIFDFEDFIAESEEEAIKKAKKIYKGQWEIYKIYDEVKLHK